MRDPRREDDARPPIGVGDVVLIVVAGRPQGLAAVLGREPLTKCPDLLRVNDLRDVAHTTFINVG